MSTLKFVQIETTTTCNQRCYFCPVSQHKREKVAMSMEMFSKIVAQLADHPIEGVFLNGFNEPTYDKQLVDKVKLLHEAGLKVHLNTNGSGLTPTLSQQLLDFLSQRSPLGHSKDALRLDIRCKKLMVHCVLWIAAISISNSRYV